MDSALSTLVEDYPDVAFDAKSTCPICKCEKTRIFHKAININPANPHAFDFRVCDSCTHGWIDPMPRQGFLSYLYAKGSRSVIGEWGESQLTIPERICLDREIDSPPAEYFELGVGQGHLYKLFLERKWHCTGVDPGDWSSSIPNVFRDLSEVPPDLKANLVIAFDVLEHVTDPIGVLAQLRKIAAANAKLYCAIPNRLSHRAKQGGADWRMVRPLGHVNYYSKKSITLAMKAAGFAVEFVRVTDLTTVKFPRSISQLKESAVELLGMGDQLVVMAKAI